MAQSTVYKRTVGGSIGAGIGSVFGGSGKTYFILEHKTSSKYYRVGETQEIIVDQIELGRDSKCQVRFDDSFTTVSRRHAAIVRDGNRWKLVQVSSTNSTLLNGQKVQNESYLHSGDEIQLSEGGPKLGFIVPAGKKATVGSIGLTRRLNLFGQQALRPYKQAITALSVLLILVIAGAVWWGTNQAGELAKLTADKTRLEQEIQNIINNPKADPATTARLDSLKQELEKTKTRIVYVTPKPDPDKVIADPKKTEPINPPQPIDQSQPSAEIKNCNPYVFAVFQDLLIYETTSGEKYEKSNLGFVGTGFILSDGRFVTARHVIEPWYYFNYLGASYSFYKLINEAAFNGGKVSAKFTIVSPSGKRYSFNNEQVICNRANDRKFTDNGSLYIEASADRYDWAYFQTSETKGLKFDNELSRTLSQGVQLEILGFPRGLGTEDINNIIPILSNSLTSRAGVDNNGLIVSSNDDTAGGNSGGPVFTKKDGNYVVVGLISGSNFEKGRIVPICEVK
ncbi:hypothetical protein AGMMS50239_27020 [Bacteroidia bacterium]|nr:hypothetical protein AGMMS50239_27020 [Bacteroidia bacterium]